MTNTLTFEEALDSIQALINRVCLESSIPGYDYEDIHQELVIKAYEVWLRYDVEKGAFSTYVYPALYKARNELYRRVTAQSRGRGVVPRSLNEASLGIKDPMDYMSEEGQDLDELLVREEMKDIIRRTIATIPDKKVRAIIQGQMANETQVETAARLGVTQSLVSYHMTKFRQNVKENLEAVGYTSMC